MRRVLRGDGQGGEGHESGSDREEVVAALDKSVDAVFELQVFFLQLVEGGEKGGDWKVK